MKKAIRTFISASLILSVSICHSQNGRSFIPGSDSLSCLPKNVDSIPVRDTVSSPHDDAGISTSRYFELLGGNMKEMLIKPFHMQKRDWKYLSAAAALAGGLSFRDEAVQRFALKLRNDHPGLRTASGVITDFGDQYGLYTLGMLGTCGFLFKKERMQTATLLATQAYITSAALVTALKFLTVRTRPSFYGPAADAEPFFQGPFVREEDYKGNRTNTSFPSGHTASAFAVATVFAREYRDRLWVPILSYSAASLVGLSRITENKHWVTDVFAGAVLGYVTGTQAVNNYHRYTGTGVHSRQRKLRFTLQYYHSILMPGLAYKL